MTSFISSPAAIAAALASSKALMAGSALYLSCCLARRISSERAVLEPIGRGLLEPEAVELACRLIRNWARDELTQVEGQAAPAVAVVASQIADLEELIASRGALAGTLRPVVANLREKLAALQRANWCKAQGTKIAEIPAEEAHRAAVADMASELGGSNVEVARAALRSLTGDIPVFERGGKLYGRLRVDPIPLFSRCNPRLIEQVGSGGPICYSPTSFRLSLAA
jgi:hypothetical protein